MPMLMRPDKAKTAAHGCFCPGDVAVRMRKVLARPWVGVQVCYLLFIVVFRKGCKLAEKIWEQDKVQQINGCTVAHSVITCLDTHFVIHDCYLSKFMIPKF